MTFLEQVVPTIYQSISVLGAVVVIWGVVEAMIRFVRIKLSTRIADQIHENESIRQQLGAH